MVKKTTTKDKIKTAHKKVAKKKPARQKQPAEPEATPVAEQAQGRNAGKRDRSPTSARKGARAQTETAQAAAVGQEPATGPKVAAAPRPAPATSVEEQNGEIIIRFPPAAPLPFTAPLPAKPAKPPLAPPAPPARARETAPVATIAEPPAKLLEPIVDEPEVPDWIEEVTEPVATETPAVAKKEAKAPARPAETGAGDERHLTQSKKRRLRRKRGRDKKFGAAQADGGRRPEGAQRTEGAKRPEGAQRTEGAKRPEGGQRTEASKRPEGAQRTESAKRPEGGQRTEASKRPEGSQRTEGGKRTEAAQPARQPVREQPHPTHRRDRDPHPAEPLEIADEDRVSWIDERETVEPERIEPDVLEPAQPDLAAPVPAEVTEEGTRREKGRRRRRRGRRSSRHEAQEGASADEVEDSRAAPQQAGKRGAPAPTAPGKTTGIVREMIINATPREECRIGILAGGRLEEIYLERATSENHVGNIYKGLITNVEPSIQAAFVDFGQGKNGFLHVSDLHPQYFPDGAGQTENVGHKLPRKNRPPIQRCLRRGQEVIVQVTKEGIGTKGPTLSTYLSVPGRFLVMMPGMGRLGVSRRIEDDESREKLRAVLGELELPENMGFIARTAALDRTKRELQGDLTYLMRLWRAVESRTKDEPAPAELYRESDLVIRTIRDVFTSDIERILVDDPDVAQRARDFLSIFSPRSNDIVTPYTDPEPIFHKYGIEAELERLHTRRVPLKSGGSLVIEPTEALVAIDVNSGRFRTEDDAESTAYKINLEAADEISRQLRLRDLGGVVVCDFIDMRMESHRRDIERRLTRNLKDHKERAKVLRTSQFGIIELTRQRQRASLTRSVYQDCRHCRGTGLVKTIESVALDVMRLIQLAVTREHIHSIEVSISPDVAYLLQNRKRGLLYELESKNRRVVSLRPDPSFSLDQVEIHCTDARGRLVPHT